MDGASGGGGGGGGGALEKNILQKRENSNVSIAHKM